MGSTLKKLKQLYVNNHPFYLSFQDNPLFFQKLFEKHPWIHNGSLAPVFQNYKFV